jgi:hypothetical protein
MKANELRDVELNSPEIKSLKTILNPEKGVVEDSA